MVETPFLSRDRDAGEQTYHTNGVLPYQRIKALIDSGHIQSREPVAESQVQPSSLDLRLGESAYQVRASFLPGPSSTVLEMVDEFAIQQIDLTRPAVLQQGGVYIVPLLEELALPAVVMGKANPKSTTGRLDVLARLLVDNAGHFDLVPKGYRGRLFVEIAPRSFSIAVRAGSTLNQLRFLRGTPPQSDSGLSALQEDETLVYRADGMPDQATIAKGLWFSVDLGRGSGPDIVGWKAKNHAPVVDLEKTGYYDPFDFWEPIGAPQKPYLILDQDAFYILRSKERVRVPAGYAAEMIPYDPSAGEFRVHYAGFFDPGFGYGQGDIKGTRAVLEVRLHEVPYALRDGQHVGRLVYERLLERPAKLYGAGAGSSYQFQDLGLSKQFKDLGAVPPKHP